MTRLGDRFPQFSMYGMIDVIVGGRPPTQPVLSIVLLVLLALAFTM
jgi:hypothetical protein